MSESDTLEAPVEGADDAPNEVEARAYNMGWRPKDQFRGPPGKWVDAAEFVRRGEDELPVLRQRARTLERLLEDQKKQTTDVVTALNEVTQHTRNASKLAYERAMKDIEARRREAVRTGNEEAFVEADRELETLKAEAPKPATTAPNAPTKPIEPEIHPATLAWARENESWFKSDEEARAEALEQENLVARLHPDWSVEDRLADVTRRMKRLRPDLFTNQRRKEPGAVSPSTPGPRQPAPPHSFENLPQDAKDAYARYAKMLEGRGKPLTKEEWADNYQWES